MGADEVPAGAEGASGREGAGPAVVGPEVTRCGRRPSASGPVVTGTTPLRVRSRIGPGPSRSASATAVATVACPQNGTSASGLKYRMS